MDHSLVWAVPKWTKYGTYIMAKILKKMYLFFMIKAQIIDVN